MDVKLIGGNCYKLVLSSGLVYEFKFIGGEPIMGKLIDGTDINVYELMDKGYLSLEEITCPK